MSLLDTASLVITPNGTKAGTLYSVVPSSGAGDMTVTRATTATRVNSAGLIESVASNVPRLDYSNGTCPSILVEPQRTNLLTYSEQFDDASWGKNNGTITANATVSPSGILNAEEWAGNGANTPHDFSKSFTGGSTTTSSIYVKKNTAQFVYISLNYSASDWGTGVYDLDNLTSAVYRSGGVTNPVATITDAGNGWRRIVLSISTASTSLFTHIGISNSLSPTFTFRGRVNYVTSASFYAWGAQLEAGSYATSYIPTTSASVTRNADVISKTGISSLIGQTEGTVFLDYIWNSPSSDVIPIAINGNGGKFMWFRQNGVQFYGNGSSILFSNNNVSAYGNRYKIAFVYGQNDFRIYINGSLSGVSTSGTFTGTFDDLVFTPIGSPTFNDSMKHNTIALWKTCLTNTQLASLTTI